jgi:hypothetical protein
VKEVRDGERPVVRRLPVRVEPEVEVEPGAAVGLAERVRQAVADRVAVRVRVVAARDGELGAGEAVRVVPTERRGRRPRRVRDERPRPVARALDGNREDAVRRAVGRLARDEVVLREQLAGLGIDADAPPVLLGRLVELDVPREPHRARLERLIDEPRRRNPERPRREVECGRRRADRRGLSQDSRSRRSRPQIADEP